MNDNPVILVFGASSGIGRAICARLSLAGARVTGASRSAEKLETLAGLFPDVVTRQADPAVPADVLGVLTETQSRHGRLDGVVNCAGSLLLKPAHLTTDDEWSQVMQANLTTAFNVVRAATGIMSRARTPGSIVLLSSAAAQFGIANHEAIAAAKAGVIGLARSAAATYARQGIRVNCVAPGLTRTPLTETITSNPRSLSASTGMHALGRIAEPDDVASAVVWLLDPANSFVTGQVIAVDGGLSTLQPRVVQPTQPNS